MSGERSLSIQLVLESVLKLSDSGGDADYISILSIQLVLESVLKQKCSAIECKATEDLTFNPASSGICFETNVLLPLLVFP